MRNLFVWVFATSLFACTATVTTGAPTGGGQGDAGDPGTGDPGTGHPGLDGGAEAAAQPPFSIADHPQIAQLTKGPGSVLSAPKVVAVTFDGDPLRAQIEDFVSKLGPSAYWSTIVSEYGVGPTTSSTAHVSAAAPATVDDAAVQTFLNDNVKAGGLLGAPDPNAIYTLIYPEGTTVTAGTGPEKGTGCQDFGGYHDEVAIGGTTIAYAIIPRCAAFPPAPSHSLGGIDFVTTALSHELAEAATDPHPNSNPAYDQVDAAHFVWSFIGGSENGDMCAGIETFWVKPTDLGYTVQRQWSDKSGLASHDPCVPAPADPYFNAAVAGLTDALALSDPSGQNPPFATLGLKLAVGSSKTIEIDLYSDQPTDDWTVSASELVDPSQPNAPHVLDLKLDKTTGKNGDKLQLTVTLKSAPTGGGEPFAIDSTYKGVTNSWYGLVGN